MCIATCLCTQACVSDVRRKGWESSKLVIIKPNLLFLMRYLHVANISANQSQYYTDEMYLANCQGSVKSVAATYITLLR